MGTKDEGGYCFDLLKEGVTAKGMSGGERAWCISIGLIGTLVADPIIWAKKKLGIQETPQEYDPNDPTHPFNQNY